MSTLTWVAGGGGLLGSQVRAALGRSARLEAWRPPIERVSWADPTRASEQLCATAQGLIAASLAGGKDSWALVWCAGVGVVGSSQEQLELESRLWEGLLDSLGTTLARADVGAIPGSIVLASSAGGVYGRGTPPFSEESPCQPVSAYGRAKLRQEQALIDWAQRQRRVSTLIARISNLYGPGQKLDKPQGLISHMARSVIHGRPIHIYVPFDTVRDYVFAEDAGVAIARWTERLGDEAAQSGTARHVVKVCASEKDTTISALVGVFRRITRRQVRVVSGLHPTQALQPIELRFRSRVWTDEPVFRTGLLEGVGRVYRAQLSLYQAGLLAPPSPHLPVTASQMPRVKPNA